MKCQMPQISWHGRGPVLSVDFQVIQGDVRRLASGGTDSHVIIWYVMLCPKNTVSIECACDLGRHNKSVNVVRFSPNGECLASGDDEGAIFIWKLREKSQPSLEVDEDDTNKENWVPFKLLRGHLDDICDISWSPNSELLMSGSIDNSIFIWDISKGQSVHVSKEAKGFVQGVTWDPLNQYLATLSSDRMLRVYNMASKKVVYRTHKAPWFECGENGQNKCSKLFHDDTLKSFCRRLTFSPDGELLFAPTGVKEKDEKQIHTTYVFSRYNLTQPVLHLPSGQRYSLAVRCCPVLFKLRDIKGNRTVTPMIKLPYRILIAVATEDGIFLYDTQQLLPFVYVSNIHYTHLTDISWSSDGRILIVSSTDGYCSFLIFNENELGEVYEPPTESPKKEQPTITDSGTDNNTTENIVKVDSKPEPTVEGTVQKESCSADETVPTASKSKTPKRVQTPPVKKGPKMCSIKSFFSQPAKEKAKKETSGSEGSEMIEVPEKSHAFNVNLKTPESKAVPSAVSSSCSEDVEMQEIDEIAEVSGRNSECGQPADSRHSPVGGIAKKSRKKLKLEADVKTETCDEEREEKVISGPCLENQIGHNKSNISASGTLLRFFGKFTSAKKNSQPSKSLEDEKLSTVITNSTGNKASSVSESSKGSQLVIPGGIKDFKQESSVSAVKAGNSKKAERTDSANTYESSVDCSLEKSQASVIILDSDDDCDENPSKKLKLVDTVAGKNSEDVGMSNESMPAIQQVSNTTGVSADQQHTVSSSCKNIDLCVPLDTGNARYESNRPVFLTPKGENSVASDNRNRTLLSKTASQSQKSGFESERFKDVIKQETLHTEIVKLQETSKVDKLCKPCRVVISSESKCDIEKQQTEHSGKDSQMSERKIVDGIRSASDVHNDVPENVPVLKATAAGCSSTSPKTKKETTVSTSKSATIKSADSDKKPKKRIQFVTLSSKVTSKP